MTLATPGFATKVYHGGVLTGVTSIFSPASGGASAEQSSSAGHAGRLADAASWNAYDASHVDGLDTSGFQGRSSTGAIFRSPRRVRLSRKRVAVRHSGDFFECVELAGLQRGILRASPPRILRRRLTGASFISCPYDGSVTHGRVLAI